MSQRQRLLDWNKNTKLSPVQFNTAALEPITLCVEDPSRLFLWIHFVEILNDCEFIITSRGDSGAMVIRGMVGQRTDYEFAVDKHYGLTTAQWVLDPIGNTFFLTVVEDVYRGQ